MLTIPLVASAILIVQQQAPARPSTATLGILDMAGVTVSADSTETKTVEMPQGTRVLLRAGSSVRHTAYAGASRGGAVEVKGEVAVEVSREQLMLRVVSRAGIAMLYPGSYALRCVAACAALEVTVARGSANLLADRHDAARLPLVTGQWGRAFRDSAAVRVDAANSKGFPLPDSTLAAVRKAP